MQHIIDRFISYVIIDTESDPNSESTPSTAKQWDLANKLVEELKPTEDILLTLGKNKPEGQVLVGFAAESDNLLANAESKLQSKNLDWIVANDISKPHSGFAADSNAVTLLSKAGEKIEMSLDSKKNIAKAIIDVLK
jgi:phosphopantothenoylcysteine synthetase/decarboxylase